MAKDITPSNFGGALQWAMVRIGIASDLDANDPDDISLVSSDVGADTPTLFRVPVGVLVRDVLVNKVTAFGSTGAFTMCIGDTDSDGFWPSSDLIASDAGMKSLFTQVSTAEAAALPAYAGGRKYTSADTLDSDGYASIVVSVGTAKINAGLAEVYLAYVDTRCL